MSKANVVMAYVRIHPIPEAMLGINREINAERIKDLTSIVAAKLHDAAETEVILRDDNIIFESLINTSLHELLSEENLYALRIIGEKSLKTGLDIVAFYIAVRSMLNLVKRTAQMAETGNEAAGRSVCREGEQAIDIPKFIRHIMSYPKTQDQERHSMSQANIDYVDSNYAAFEAILMESTL